MQVPDLHREKQKYLVSVNNFIVYWNGTLLIRIKIFGVHIKINFHDTARSYCLILID